MSRSPRGSLLGVAVIVFASFAGALAVGPALGQPAPPFPTITNLGVLPTGATTEALAVNADGTVVTGICFIQPGGRRAFRWQGGVMTNLNLLPGGSYALGLAVSGDGSVVVGEADRSGSTVSRAFRQISPFPMSDLLPTFPGSKARGVSGNGLVVVGEGTPAVGAAQMAYRWTSATGAVDLGTLPGHTSAIAHATNGDGSVVVGASIGGTSGSAVRWTSATGMVSLGTLPGGASSVAYGVSSDGLTVVGASFVGSLGTAFVWTQAAGMKSLGSLGGPGGAVASGVDGTGRRVVGAASFSPTAVHAFLWTQAIGTVDLNTYLPVLGTDLTGWVLERANAISADGRVIVGDGRFNGFSRGWLVRLDLDSDDDGLLDNWETDGVPYIDTLGILHRLPLPNADPQEKDLYVEVDAMQGQGLAPSAVQMVVEAFSNAPVSNPSGIPGINLHIVEDDNDLPHVAFWQTGDDCWPLDFDVVRQNHFGTFDERSHPDVDSILKAKAKAYRYCIIADRASSGWGGCGGQPADNFVIYQRSISLDTHDAAKFMHELGHNLNLGHGGGDRINGKPNYPSIMNYTVAYPYQWCDDFWKLDYSRAGPKDLGTLNENSLDEAAGIGSAGGPYAGWLMPFGFNFNDGTKVIRRVDFVALDGGKADFGDEAGAGFQDGKFTTGVKQDLNYLLDQPLGVKLPSAPSPGDKLEAHDDWANIVLALQAVRSPSGIPQYPQDELTEDAIAWINENFPKAPTACFVDCTGDGKLDIQDFACFQNRFALGSLEADCTGDGKLDIQDFVCFQNRFALGCR